MSDQGPVASPSQEWDAQTAADLTRALESAASEAASARSDMGSGGERGGRRHFAVDELAIVLSHYQLGTIEAIQPFKRGSRKAPKLVIRTDSGLYLIKRRAPGKDDPYKVAFCHAIQLHLADQQFPLPHLIGTRKDNNSMLRWKDGIYEVFEYIKGTPYDASHKATADAGKILALFHKLLRDFEPQYEPHKGSYHGSKSVPGAIEKIPGTLARVAPATIERDPERFERLLRFHDRAYEDARQRVEKLGLGRWPTQIVHGDWHPGNMLFRGPRVVAVIDYDGARYQQRVIDVANGALQFSITGKGTDAREWPDELDVERFKYFLNGYDGVPDCVLSRAELEAVPWLMVEALIAETVLPIAATGSFAEMEGVAFLSMVKRKVRWLQKHADDLVKVLGL